LQELPITEFSVEFDPQPVDTIGLLGVWPSGDQAQDDTGYWAHSFGLLGASTAGFTNDVNSLPSS
jgi:hypothetical protein